MSHILVLCPLHSEKKHLLRGFEKRNFHFEEIQTPKIKLHSSSRPAITVSVGGHGKVQYGIQTQYLLSRLSNLTGVICLGAGGGLAKHLKVGDLVISEKTLEHDYEERFNPTARLPEFSGDPTFLKWAREIRDSRNLILRKPQPEFEIHFGQVASGDEDIIDPVRAEELYERTQALAVAWEGAGGARACAFHGIPFLEIRAITDNARNSVSESFRENLPQAMDNAADFLLQMLS
jgi:adenosylhomocysteine nucleosidase